MKIKLLKQMHQKMKNLVFDDISSVINDIANNLLDQKILFLIFVNGNTVKIGKVISK